VESLKGKKDQKAVKASLDAWFDEISKAAWPNSASVKKLYLFSLIAQSTVSLLALGFKSFFRASRATSRHPSSVRQSDQIVGTIDSVKDASNPTT